MVTVSFCRLGRTAAEPFASYVLPQVNRLLNAGEEENCTVLGAIWDDRACAAAVARWRGEEGELLSLFVDPAARRQGIGGRLTDLLAEEGRRCRARTLRCGYVLRGEELEAMDRLFRRRGAALFSRSPVWSINSADFSDSPLLGPALRPGYAMEEKIVLFSGLSAAQLAELESEPSLPPFLRPSARRDATDPGLSAAWVEDKRPVAFALGSQSGEDMFGLTGVWRGPLAPEGSLRKLIAAQLNNCWYRCGGDFRLFASPVNDKVRRMLERFTGGRYEQYEQHEAELPIPEEETQ